MEQELSQKFADLDEDGVLKLVRRAIEDGTDPQVILKACQDGMITVGEKFENGIYFISDLMLSGHMFKEVSELLKPLFGDGSDTATKGKVVVGTVSGDIHDIGKDIVVRHLEANSYGVVDLGVDVPAERFVSSVKETGARVVGLSGLLTIAFDSMKDTVQALEDAGIRDNVKVMIGGSIVSRDICKFAGADGWGNDTQKAVNLCKEWIK
jgi:5-methyltetrahydrofolate--homocysteine methyltransferase